MEKSMGNCFWKRIKIEYVLKPVFLLLCTVFLFGCGDTEVTEGGFPVYFLNTGGTKLITQEISLSATTTEGKVTELLEELKTTPIKLEYIAPLAQDSELLSFTVKDGRVVLDFDSSYYRMPASKEVLVRAAVVKTLTSLEDIRYVFFMVNGEGLVDAAGMTTGWMNADSFIYNDGNEINTYEEVKVKLFFATQSGTELTSAYREKYYSTNTPMERFVVDEVIAGPSGQIQGMYASVNSETRVLSVSTRDRICYVNLDGAFLTPPEGVSMEASIYSIVNSIMSIGSVDKVQIMISGEVPAGFASAYEMNEEITTSLQ